MSNLGNYSPYNKTYKFILFQNQAYHERNKRNANPCIRTNLQHSLSRKNSSARNPERIDVLLNIWSCWILIFPVQKCQTDLHLLRIKLIVLVFSQKIEKLTEPCFHNQREWFINMRAFKSLEVKKLVSKMFQWYQEYLILNVRSLKVTMLKSHIKIIFGTRT